MLTRRDFLAYFGGLTLASAAVCALPDVLGRRGWWSAAYAQDTDLVLDTYNGLAATVVDDTGLEVRKISLIRYGRRRAHWKL